MDIYEYVHLHTNIPIDELKQRIIPFDDVPPWNKGNGDYIKGKLNPMYGTKRPQNVKDAISKANTGKPNPALAALNAKKKWWTNGETDTCKAVCPPGFYAGRSKIKGSSNPVNVRWSSYKKL